MSPRPLAEPLRILVVAPHPDDAELAMGGTLAKLVDDGHDVLVADMTDGEPTPHGTPLIRARETEAATQILGVKRTNLGFRNRFVEHSIEARHRVAGLIRTHRASVLFAPHPEDAHPDHLATTRIVEDARFDAKLTRIELPGEPIYPRWLFHYYATHLRRVADPTFLIDVTGYEERKRKAILCYHSQFIANERNRGVLQWVDAALRYFGSRAGVAAAEPFSCREPIALTALDRLT
ncbi:MAG TPA: PIG-L family deacetylase [Phycisphaerales bacterium]|nr:PIG-L family deacetylase [Phycisphaerales bacterium]HMP36800.1 PIG-L family deacetylase [Phycisphaerales bacterium]